MYLYVYFLIERFVIEHDLFDFNDERNFIIWLDMNYHNMNFCNWEVYKGTSICDSFWIITFNAFEIDFFFDNKYNITIVRNITNKLKVILFSKLD